MSDGMSFTTRFKADTSDFSKGTSEIVKKLDEYNKALVDNQYKQKDCNKTISDARRELKNIEKEIGENKKANEDQKKRIEELNNTIEDEKLKLSKLKTEQAGLRQVISETSKEILNNNNQWTILKGTLANLASDGLQKVGSKLLEIGRDIIQTGEQFTASMSEVQAISGATGEQLKQLEEAARLYGSTTKFSANEVADALKYMALAGWDAQTSISALPGVLDLAAASGMGLAQASDMVTDYLSAFGMEASQASYFSDLLTYAQGNSNTSAEQLGEAYRNCAANLNAAGQDIETVTSMLEAMANQGLKGSQSGTALTAVMRDITSKMEDGAVKIGNVSVAVQDAEGNFRDLTDIMTDVSKAVDGMGTATRATALSSVFTEESIKGVNLILNEGVDKIADYESALRSSTGAASEAAKVMNDNLSGDIKNEQSAFDELKLKIYEDAESPLRSLVQTITKSGVPALESIIDNLDKVIPVIVGAATAMGTMKASLAIGKLIYDLSGGMKNLTFTTQAQTVATQAQTVATEAQTVATEGATVATHGLNAAMAANVIGLVLSGVMALVSALGSYAIMSGSASEATENYTDCLEELNKANETAKENMASAKEEAANIQALAAEYDELRNQASLTVGEKKRLDDIASQLADTLGTTTEALKDKNGAYMDISSSIDDYIDKLIEQAKYEAYAEKIRAAATDKLNDEDNLENAKKVRDEAKKALEDYNKWADETYGKRLMTSGEDVSGIMSEVTAKQNQLKDSINQAEETVHKYEVAVGYANTELEVAQEKIKELGNATDDTSDSTLSAEEATENYNKKLNEYENLLTNADDALKNTTDEQSSLKQELTDANKALDENKKLIKDETENLKKLIDEQSKCNTETEDGKNKYKDLQEKIDKSSSTLSVYIDKQKELGQNVSNVKTKIEQAAEASKTLDEKLAELSKQSNSLRSEMNSLASSLKQLEKGEALSLDTLISLTEKYPEYTDMLLDAAGNADAQKRALELLFDAKKQDYILTQQSAIDNINADNEETINFISNVNERIKALKKLRDSATEGSVPSSFIGPVLKKSALDAEINESQKELDEYEKKLSDNETRISQINRRIAAIQGLSYNDFSSGSSSSSSSSKSSENSGGKSKSTNTTHFTSSYKGEMYTADYSYQDGDYDAVKAADTAVKATLGVLDRVKNLGKLTLQEEIYNLKELLKRQGISADQRYEIKYKLYQAENKLAQDQEKKQQEIEKKAEERRKAAAERQAAFEKANAERREALEKAARERLEKAANELLERQQLALAAYKRLVDGRIEKLNAESQAAQENADKQIAALDAVAKKRKQTQQDEEYQKKLDAINAKLRYQQMDEFTRYELERQKQDLLNEMAEIKAERMLENQKTAITGTSGAIKNKNQLAISGLQAMNDQFADRMAYLQGSQTYDQRVANNSTTQNITVVQNGLNGDQLLAKLLKKLGA